MKVEEKKSLSDHYRKNVIGLAEKNPSKVNDIKSMKSKLRLEPDFEQMQKDQKTIEKFGVEYYVKSKNAEFEFSKTQLNWFREMLNPKKVFNKWGKEVYKKKYTHEEVREIMQMIRERRNQTNSKKI